MMLRVEIEDELIAQSEAAAKQQGVNFKEFFSTALKVAVAQAKFATPPVFTQKVHDFGVHLDSPWSLLADLETNAAVMLEK
jgi:hypothetical protein